jgi:hypothetical protein
VGEQAVEADGDAEAGDDIEDQRHHDGGQIDGVTPEPRDEDGQGHGRAGHDGHRDQFLRSVHHGRRLFGHDDGVTGAQGLANGRLGNHGTSGSA